VNQVGGQDELVFDGGSFVMNRDGALAHVLPFWRDSLTMTRWEKADGKLRCTGCTQWTEEPRLSSMYHAMVLGLAWYRTLTWKMFVKVCLDTVETTSTVLFIVAAASIFGWMLTATGVTSAIAQWVLGFTHEAWVFLLLANVLMLFVGCFLEPTAAITILVPILVPICQQLGIDLPWVDDTDLSAAELDTVAAVVTTAAIGIANTGTIVLDHGPGQGRRAASLMPDVHVCIVTVDQIVSDVPEAVARLIASGSPARPQTWISGPSATSDIELDRVEGVHGPRTLRVIIAGGPGGQP